MLTFKQSKHEMVNITTNESGLYSWNLSHFKTLANKHCRHVEASGHVVSGFL